MTDAIKLPERPPLRFDLSSGDDIKMTYGLEMDLRKLLPNAQTTLQLVMHDPYTQDYIVRRCLTPSAKSIKDEASLIDADEVKIPSEEIERLLMWATDHVLYFFVTRANSMGQLGVRYQTLVPAVPEPTASETGSETSAMQTPSAGPTE